MQKTENKVVDYKNLTISLTHFTFLGDCDYLSY